MSADVLDTAAWLKATRDRLRWTAAEVAVQAKKIAKLRGHPLRLTQQSVSHFETGKAKSVPHWVEYVREAAKLASLSPALRKEREQFIKDCPNGITEMDVDEAEHAVFTMIQSFPDNYRVAILAALCVPERVVRLLEPTAGDAVPSPSSPDAERQTLMPVTLPPVERLEDGFRALLMASRHMNEAELARELAEQLPTLFAVMQRPPTKARKSSAPDEAPEDDYPARRRA